MQPQLLQAGDAAIASYGSAGLRAYQMDAGRVDLRHSRVPVVLQQEDQPRFAGRNNAGARAFAARAELRPCQQVLDDAGRRVRCGALGTEQSGPSQGRSRDQCSLLSGLTS